MNSITLKPFKSGNSLALRIPASLKLKETDEFTLIQMNEGKFLLEVGIEKSQKEKVEDFFNNLDPEAWEDFELPEREQGREIPEW